jgi:hypothetical protein
MSKEPIYQGMLNLARLGEAVKASKEDGQLFIHHNKKMDKIAWRIDQSLHDLKIFYSMISSQSLATIESRIAIEAPRKPYNQRSMQGLYLEWVLIRKCLLEDLNAFQELHGEDDFTDAIYNTIESVDLTISADYARN